MEFGLIFLMHTILSRMELPGWLSLLLFSNRLHLYNVRVVVNDTPVTLLAMLAVWAILHHRSAQLTQTQPPLQ